MGTAAGGRDEDWHAVCQAIDKGTEGEEWERLHFKYVEVHEGGQHSEAGPHSHGKGFVEVERRKDKRGTV